MELDVQLCSLQIYFWGNAIILNGVTLGNLDFTKQDFICTGC